MSIQSMIWQRYLRGGCAAALLTALSLGAPAFAGTVSITGGVASGQEGDHTLGAAAARAMTEGRCQQATPMSPRKRPRMPQPTRSLHGSDQAHRRRPNPPRPAAAVHHRLWRR